jgi:hypothetical protein
VLQSASAVGYLAPEQLRRSKGASTRSALVDSFGIGMTLLYLAGGHEPVPEQHRHESWLEDVASACESLPRTAWVSLPARVGRLIVSATQDSQSARIDVAAIQRELEALQVAVEAPTTLDAPDLVAEELAARSHMISDYVWDEDAARAIRDSPSGITLSVAGDFSNEEISVELKYSATGNEDRAKLNRYIGEAAKAIPDQFRGAGWRLAERDTGYAHLVIRVAVPVGVVAADLDRHASALDRIFGKLAFDRT